ncbi:amidohydrolase [Rufibacter glacialis]|uniref:Amidohydrolase n=1 Tax=Rufibacter glacialis TaxID=1259555 RepID=A0A5M8QMV4_9BACT|nr:amidohydrolase [Rufibacter glacialis]KAA6437409.1 amidohydrolase [Rufibacter glacialis]GGK59517.1 N-acyl-L-amino acid amidohydrolase [Rufibacter glacialis]
MNTFQKWASAAALLAFVQTAQAQTANLYAQIDQLADKLEPKVIQWRRDFHQNPELSNREVKTAEKIAKHLKSLGFEVKTGVAKTGVVGILKGGQPGPVVALRADMDALPVTERNSLPFASKVRTTFNNQQVGVMHACGHDTHMAMLLGAAEILAQHKKDIKGTVKFIFQPAEEGAPAGEEGGADVMVAEGVLENPKVDAIFGLHINSATEVGTMKYRPQGTMASSDNFKIRVKGRQAHGAYPWASVDPIVVSAQIITGIQTIVSRQMELTKDAAVITVGAIHGGVRSNIIPEEVEMIGTIRALDTLMQNQLHAKLRRTAELIAASAGATAEVEIVKNTPVTYNHEQLTAHMLPSLERVAGKPNVILTKAVTGAEDFAYYQQKVPGVFIFVGGMAKGQDPAKVPAHHTPDFMIDESGMKLGVRTLAYLALDYLNNPLK